MFLTGHLACSGKDCGSDNIEAESVPRIHREFNNVEKKRTRK